MFEKFRILKINIKNSFYEDTAYIANGWGNLFSVVFFMLSNILFLDVIFQNVKTIAGYSRDEILLFNIISQFWFFIIYNIFLKNLELFNQSVNTGQLDLILTKPLPSLFYVICRNINIINTLRDGVPSLLIIILATQWQNIETNLLQIFIGFIIALLGIACSVAINFIAAFPVFWLGNNQSVLDLVFLIEDNTGHSNIVYEVWNDFWKLIFTLFLPTAISSAVSTSVILGKSPAFEMLFVSFIITGIFILIMNFLWKLGLKNYTSASS